MMDPTRREYLVAHAHAWIDAWNRRDLDAILAHYAADVRFAAPTVATRWGRPDGVLHGTGELRRHVARGLENAPSLRFELIDVLFSVGGMAILYRRETGATAIDVVTLDAHGRAVAVVVYYTTPPA